MTEERVIIAAVVTSGEKVDGKVLDILVDKSRNAGMTVEDIVGYKVYSCKDNIEIAKEKDYKLIAKLKVQSSVEIVKRKMSLNFIKILVCVNAKLDVLL